MFSGIVPGQGVVKKVGPSAIGYRLKIHSGKLLGRLKLGDSVAVNGCCLTLVKRKNAILEFDLLEETWQRTTFHRMKVGDRVNLEASLKVGDDLGGHFITGHIDERAPIRQKVTKGADVLLQIRPSRKFMRWLVEKGSITVDGVSLTVARLTRNGFDVWLIPHTLQKTTLGWKKRGDWINLEGDILAKYAQRRGSPS
jgi:riboflavin synthase